MPRFALPLALLPALAVFAMTAQAAPPWTVLDASRLAFTARQEGQPVEGRFEDFEATIVFAEDDLAGSRIDVAIDTASATMGQSERDQAIRSSALLAVETYPSATFASRRIEQTKDGYAAAGTLTIRDVSREVVVPFTLDIREDPDDPAKLRASARGEVSIDRLDYGVGQGDFASTTTIANEVVIRLEIEATRPR